MSEFTLSEPAKPVFNPLAHPCIIAVTPFWAGADDDAFHEDDIDDPATLFKSGLKLPDGGLLHLDRDTLAAIHGEAVAERLDGRTGLYVAVSDLDEYGLDYNNEGAVSPVLSDRPTRSGFREVVVETPACLAIIAVKSENHDSLYPPKMEDTALAA
ncbi:MAG: hypothetical protein AAGE61_21295 [Pseudomonadota bacterium]